MMKNRVYSRSEPIKEKELEGTRKETKGVEGKARR